MGKSPLPEPPPDGEGNGQAGEEEEGEKREEPEKQEPWIVRVGNVLKENRVSTRGNVPPDQRWSNHLCLDVDAINRELPARVIGCFQEHHGRAAHIDDAAK